MSLLVSLLIYKPIKIYADINTTRQESSYDISVVNWNVQQVVVGACTRGCPVGIVGNPTKVLPACQKLATYMKHEI